MKEIILRLVNNNSGLKAVDLSMKLMSEINPVVFVFEDYWNALTELIKAGEIVEIEYRVPQANYIKSMYFPKGTEVYGNTIDFTKESWVQQRRDAEAGSV